MFEISEINNRMQFFMDIHCQAKALLQARMLLMLHIENSKKDAAFGGGAFVSLGHELAHTLDRYSGTMDMGTWFVTPEGKKIPNAEKFSTFIENKIRYENNLPLRRAYAVDNNGRPRAGWILDSKNRSVHFDKQGDMSSRHTKRRNRYVFR